MCRYERVLSSVHSIENKFEFEKDGCESSSSGMGAWKNVEDFVFFDQTSVEPQPLMETVEYNYLQDGIRAAGFFLVALALLICIGSGIWVF